MASKYSVQRFAVIGLGRFGCRLATNLASAGQEVIAVDRKIELVEQMRDHVSLAVALDATDEKALCAQGIHEVDVAVVGIGDYFEARVLITVTLKQIGVPRVISRAVTPAGAQIMHRIGADGVVNPENESADRWAIQLANPWFLSRFDLDDGHSIVEITTPDHWVGKTLANLNLRQQRGLHIVAMKVSRGTASSQASDRATLQIPLPDYQLTAQDVLVMMGRDEDLARLGEG